MFNVGEQLRRFRRKSNLTLDQLAVTSGVDRGTISRIELGHVSPRINTIYFLCEAMGTSLSRFFEAPEAAPGGPSAPAGGAASAGRPAGTAAAAGRAAEEDLRDLTGAPLSGLPGAEGYWPVPTSFWQGLLEVLERFEALVRNGSELILVQNRAGQILYASPACERILGRPSAEVIGRQGRTLVHPDDLPQFETLLETLYPIPDGTGSLDYRLSHGGGTWQWVTSRFCNQVNNPNIQAFVINSLPIRTPFPA